MIYIIIAVNLLITLLNIYIAVKMWQIRWLTARITAILVNYESYFGLLLKIAPSVIYQGQDNIVQAHQNYQHFQLRTAQARQVIWLLNQSYKLWGRV